MCGFLEFQNHIIPSPEVIEPLEKSKSCPSDMDNQHTSQTISYKEPGRQLVLKIQKSTSSGASSALQLNVLFLLGIAVTVSIFRSLTTVKC